MQIVEVTGHIIVSPGILYLISVSMYAIVMSVNSIGSIRAHQNYVNYRENTITFNLILFTANNKNL